VTEPLPQPQDSDVYIPEDDIVPDPMFSPADDNDPGIPALQSVWSTDEMMPEFMDMVKDNEDLNLE
jgi:hypothetical protein